MNHRALLIIVLSALLGDTPGAWYGPALDWAKVRGLVSGYPGNEFRPNNPVLRAPIVQILFQLNSDGLSWSNWSGGPLATWRF